jgi:hypothetical protein
MMPDTCSLWLTCLLTGPPLCQIDCVDTTVRARLLFLNLNAAAADNAAAGAFAAAAADVAGAAGVAGAADVAGHAAPYLNDVRQNAVICVYPTQGLVTTYLVYQVSRYRQARE